MKLNFDLPYYQRKQIKRTEISNQSLSQRKGFFFSVCLHIQNIFSRHREKIVRDFHFSLNHDFKWLIYHSIRRAMRQVSASQSKSPCFGAHLWSPPSPWSWLTTVNQRYPAQITRKKCVGTSWKKETTPFCRNDFKEWEKTQKKMRFRVFSFRIFFIHK